MTAPASPTGPTEATGQAPSPADRRAAPPAGGAAALALFRQRDFTLLWIGLAISHTGSWMQQVTQNWLLWELTHAPLALGLYGLCRSVPFVVLSLYAGAMADRLDRRRLLIVSNAVNALFPLALGTLAALGQLQPVHIYLAAVCAAVVDAFDLPARQALLPALVPRVHLMAAVGLTSSLRRVTSLIGPSLGGVTVLTLGAASAFYLHALGFGAVVLAATLLRARPPRPPRPTSSALTMVGAGLGYVRHHPLLGTMMAMEALITLCTSYYGMLPVFADIVLGVGVGGLGLLMSAPGVGAVVGSFALASRGDVVQKGRLLLVSGGLFGLCLIGFAASGSFALSLGFLVAGGALDTVYGALRNTIVQLVVDEPFRGRVMSLQLITGRGLGPSGNFVTGALATVVGAPLALGGLACVATLLVLWRGVRLAPLRDYRGS